jgi:tRNA (cmo5U34)-methyltransferase
MTDPSHHDPSHHDSVRDAFDRAVPAYDRLRRQLVPHFDTFYGTALDLLAEAVGAAPFRCLDLGIGTGLLAEMVLERFPQANLIGTDIAPAMIAAAADRLRRFGARVRLDLGDYAALALPQGLDAVISALSIHHLDHAAKRHLFGTIRDALRPGGIFINADQVLGPSPDLERRYQERWEADARQAGVGPDDLGQALERLKLDRNATMEDQIDWLRAAGFDTVDIAWKRFRFTVFCAARAG